MLELYPPIEPYDQGMLDVGDDNLVSWETCGSPDGKDGRPRLVRADPGRERLGYVGRRGRLLGAERKAEPPTATAHRPSQDVGTRLHVTAQISRQLGSEER